MHQQTLSSHPGLISCVSETSGQLCVNRRKRRVLCPHVSTTLDLSPVVRVLSSTLLPGFTGPESSVLPVNLPPSAPATASGSPIRLKFYGLYRHRRKASLGKTHHLSISRPASLWFGSPDIRSRLPTRARPPPHSHLAGSLSATYMDSASCFLQAPRPQDYPCLVGVVLPSGNGGRFITSGCFLLSPEARLMRHAGRT